MIFKWNLNWANLGSPEASKRRNGFQGKNGEEPWWKTTQDCCGFTCIEISCGWSLLMFLADTNLSTDPLISSSISFAAHSRLPKNISSPKIPLPSKKTKNTSAPRLFVSVLERWSSNSPWKGPVHGGLWLLCFGRNVCEPNKHQASIGGFSKTPLLALRNFAHRMFLLGNWWFLDNKLTVDSRGFG